MRFRLLLALDTATTTASVALYDYEQDRLLAELSWEARRRQTQELLPAVMELLARQAKSVSDLTALAVTTGPGSFTGVRIAISTAKGLALGLPSLPMVLGLPTLSVTAAPLLLPASSVNAHVVAYLQAGRGRYNWVHFERPDLLQRPQADEHAAGNADDFATALAGLDGRVVWLVGEPTTDLSDAMGGLPHVMVVDAVSGLRRAGQLARLAALHLAAGQHDDPATLAPIYLRQP